MFNYRYRRCSCANNDSCDTDSSMLEDGCNNICTACSKYDTDDCECGFEDEESVFPENPMLGQSYVPIQYMDKTFKPAIGLRMGTLFPELVSPYSPGQSMQEIAYIMKTNTIGKGCNTCQ